MKSRMKVILLLLLGLLIVFIIPTDGIQAYYNKSLSYAPNNHQWFDHAGERGVTNQVVEYIAQRFAWYGYWYYVGEYYIDAQTSHYTTGIWNAEHDYAVDYVAFFSKGHIYESPTPEQCVRPHRALMARTPYTHIWDREIGDITIGKTHLAVIWHCGTAQAYERYLSMICETCGRYYSFPMAFTKSNTMSMDGYYNPSWGDSTFLGFYGYSEQFLSNQGLNYPWYYYHFVSYFYMMLVENQFTVNDAIDQACFVSAGKWWGIYPHNHWISQFKANWDPGILGPYDTQMKILGDGDAHYPGYPW